jgi:hypothetical protein
LNEIEHFSKVSQNTWFFEDPACRSFDFSPIMRSMTIWKNWDQTTLTFVLEMEYVTVKSITGHGENLDLRGRMWNDEGD